LRIAIDQFLALHPKEHVIAIAITVSSPVPDRTCGIARPEKHALVERVQKLILGPAAGEISVTEVQRGLIPDDHLVASANQVVLRVTRNRPNIGRKINRAVQRTLLPDARKVWPGRKMVQQGPKSRKTMQDVTHSLVSWWLDSESILAVGPLGRNCSFDVDDRSRMLRGVLGDHVKRYRACFD
jgi:hypothetical protein